MKQKHIFLFSCFLLLCTPAFTQKKFIQVGGKIISERSAGRYAPGAGFQFIYNVTNHSGMETGLYYEINPRSFLSIDSSLRYNTEVFREKVLRIPFLYRFESKLINFTAGGAFDYLVNKEQLESYPNPWYKSHEFMRTEWLVTLSISRNFIFKKSIVIEPEFRASSPVPAGGVDLGLNISLRKIIY